MRQMKFTLKKGYQFDRGDVKGISYNTKNQFSRMSAAIFNINGQHPKMKSLDSDRLYFVLKGKGIFTINTTQIIVQTNNVIIVPKNTPYGYSGKMRCFLVHSPAFDRKKEIRYDN